MLAPGKREAILFPQPDQQQRKAGKREKPVPINRNGLYKYSGDVLLSHDLAIIVSSALESLTSVFGMGTGVTSPV